MTKVPEEDAVPIHLVCARNVYSLQKGVLDSKTRLDRKLRKIERPEYSKFYILFQLEVWLTLALQHHSYISIR